MPTFIFRRGGRLQNKIKFDICTRTVGILGETNLGDQLVSGRVGEVVVQIFVPSQIDLRRQVTMARRRDKEMNMRRTLTMAPQLVKQLLGRAIWTRRWFLHF